MPERKLSRRDLLKALALAAAGAALAGVPSSEGPRKDILTIEDVGKNDLEISLFDGENNIIYHTSPNKNALKTAESMAEGTPLYTEEALLRLETGIHMKMNEVRRPLGAPDLRRTDALNLASAFLADYMEKHPKEPLSHSVPASHLLEMEPAVLREFGVESGRITKEQLAAAGIDINSIIRSTGRARLACLLLHLPDIAREGNITEIAIRGYLLTIQRAILGWQGSESHNRAMTDENMRFSGPVAKQDESGLVTVAVVLAGGPQGTDSSAWETSLRGLDYKVNFAQAY